VTTRISCGMVDDLCRDQLRNSYSYLFQDETERDDYFSESPEQLLNDGGKQTIVFIGVSALDYMYWNGPDAPATYDNSYWVTVPVNSTTSGDVHYWGDPAVELSMRARRDPADGNLVFERLLSGVWVEKFRISDSALVDTMKFVEAMEMPVVKEGELALYNALVRDGDNGDIWVLRPVFMDYSHNHFMVVAALPDGRLRVPQNVDAALMDPENVPLQYKYVLFETDSTKIKQALEALIGSYRLDASAIKNLPGGDLAIIGVVGENLGTFTGSIIPDNTTVKVALQSLETVLDAIDVDATITSFYNSTKYTISGLTLSANVWTEIQHNLNSMYPSSIKLYGGLEDVTSAYDIEIVNANVIRVKHSITYSNVTVIVRK